MGASTGSERLVPGPRGCGRVEMKCPASFFLNWKETVRVREMVWGRVKGWQKIGCALMEACHTR